MGKVVILEGPDGGGKTTLAKHFESIGFTYLHEGPPPLSCDLIDYYKMRLYQALIHDVDCVFDRLHLGETIYGSIMRNNDRLGLNGVNLFERVARSKAVFQYLCLPSQPTLEANFKEKIKEKDDYVKSWSNFFAIRDRYDEVNAIFKWPIYNYEIDSPDKIAEYIVNPVRQVFLPSGAIGSIDAEILFIGDVPNHPWVDLPFFALTGSSGYFNEALALTGLAENQVAISNAYSPDGKGHDLHQLIACLPRLRYVLVMGNVAEHWVKFKKHEFNKLGLHLVKISHPSYLKRFRGNDPNVMKNMILEALNGYLDSRI